MYHEIAASMAISVHINNNAPTMLLVCVEMALLFKCLPVMEGTLCAYAANVLWYKFGMPWKRGVSGMGLYRDKVAITTV